MSIQIHLHHRVIRQLSEPENQTQTKAIAAARAKTVIRHLVSGLPPASSGLLEQRTDRRMKNSFKFDLGSGFRLICVRAKNQIHVVFFGGHDRCDTWLSRHGRNKMCYKGQTRVLSRQRPLSPGPEPVFPEEKATVEQHDFPRIEQKYLRRVFRGLTGALSG